MSESLDAPETGRRPFGRKNLVALGLALGFLVGGYGVLAAGSPSVAAVLLVLGYVVLFPLAIAL